MDQYTARIQSKMSKMESSLLDLTNEILTAIKFLVQLKENSTEIVKNLNSITTPELYLKEFMSVNCFILKYLNFLTEVNCKFEMFEMSEKNFKPGSKCKSEIDAESIIKTDSSSNFGSVLDLNYTKDDVKPPDTHHSVFNNNDKVNSVISNNGNGNIKDNLNPDFIQDIFLSEKMIISDSETNGKRIPQPDSNDLLKETLSECESSSLTSSFSSSAREKHGFKNDSSCGLTKSNNSPHKEAKSETQSVNGDNLESENASPNLVTTDVGDSNSETCRGTCEENKAQRVGIKPANIVRKLGEEYDVLIENIKSPSEFYVRFKNNQSHQLFQLESELKLIPRAKNKFFVKRNESRKAWFSKEFGNYALFYSKCDEMWFRAEITNWCLNFPDDFVTVFLLDYGEFKCVSIDDLQSMPEIFKEYPAFAQRCHLHGVFPSDMDKSSEALFWEKESTEKMKYLTESSDNIRIKIAPDDSFHSPTSLPVTVWLVDQGNQCVNELLVESKYAVRRSASNKEIETTKDNHIIENESLNNWNPMKEDFESYQNNYDLDVNDPSAIIYGYVGNDYKKVCPHFAKTGYCFKGGACRKEHKRLDPLGFTTDQEEIYNNAFNTLPIPPPKSVINVQVTCLLTFKQFCCIPVDSFYSGEENLQSLLKFMNKAENLREMKKLLIPPSTGQIVIARYSEDCSWYRARILESQPEKDLYTVLFVDYGNKETLPLSSIRAIEARYLHLPFQSMQCFIFGVDRNPKVPLKDIMDFINNRIYSGHITIEVVSKLPGEGTNLLVHVFDQNGKNIGDELIAKEYAVSKSEILISDNSESIPG